MDSTKIVPRDVVDALETLTPEQTKELFYHLGVGLHVMSSIESQQKGNMQKIHIVQVWFDKGLEVSWNSIVAALKKIGMNALAGSVASQHNIEGRDNLTSDPVNPSAPAQGLGITPVSTSVPTVASTAHLSAGSMPGDPIQPHPSIVSSSRPLTASGPMEPLTPVASSSLPETNNANRVQQVKEEMEQFQENFTSMMSMTRSALCKKESEDSEFIEEFRDYLLFLPLSKKAAHAKFFDDREDDIIKAESVRKLLAILGRYCDYSNYELLLHLIKKFCNTAEKKRMQDYCKSLEIFEMATPVNVYLIAISASPTISEAFSRMALKMNKPVSECTLHEIRKLKESLTEKAFLHSYSVYIDTIAESSVLVVLRFPPDCIGWVLAALTPDFMDTHHLTEVSVDGEYLTLYPKLHPEKEEVIGAEEVPADHVTGTDPLPQITDIRSEDKVYTRHHSQISADEELARQLQLELNAMSDVQERDEGVTVPLHGDLQSTLTDEDYARQLQFEFGTSSQGNVTALLQPSLMDEEYAHQLQQREVDTDQDQLWDASEAGDVVRVASLLNSGADIETRGGLWSDTPLSVASGKGHLHIVRLLLQRGATIETRDEAGYTPLVTATDYGKCDVVIELLDHGADVNAQNDAGKTALMKATFWGMTEVVAELVKGGADLNLQNENGDSAVMQATVGHQSDALRELVRSGADLNLQNQEGLTALMISARSGETELTDILLTGENIDPDIQENNTGWSALFFSAKKGNVSTTKLLLKAGANAHLRDKNGLTSLDVATFCNEGDSEAVCKLLHMYMYAQESATVQSHHCTAETTTQQESSNSEHSSTQDGANRQRGLSPALRNLANISSQRVVEIFNQLERRLKSVDKSRQLDMRSEGRDGTQSKQKQK